ncbi:MAG TPA: transcriptional regulator [Gammaproteobacteria bacterium]|nr:transcriptional regulator [Gammaproteobacteria bacterium]
MLRAFVSVPQLRSQRQIAHTLLEARGIVRLVELRSAGVTAATVSRMERAGEVMRLARGLYQLPNAPLDAAHSLAEVAKRLPKGIVCLVSALAFHGLTDQLPKKIWLAIGKKDWAPKPDSMPIRVIRFTEGLLAESVETHVIEGVPVKVFGVAKTVADCFRHRSKVGLSVAVEGLQEALRQRKATPAEIARQAEHGGVSTVIRPYLEALTTNG